MMTRKLFLTICALAFACQMRATVSLPPLFGDGMVLQQQTQTKIWGNADAGAKVSLTTGWDNKLYTCTAAPNGGWMLRISTPAAGGPYTITIDDGEKLTINNVLVGEVWICSGQSNMEMPIKGYPNQPVEGASDIIMDAADYNVRAFTVYRAIADSPSSTCQGKWVNADYANVPSISATAYLFARRLQKTLKVPVGIIVSAWGGSSILGWMDRTTVERVLSEQEKAEVLKVCGTPKDQPSVLYNGMIAPLAGYAAKGFIWYQGEANILNNKFYGKMLKGMILGWRAAWGDRGVMPFYAVEIAPYRYGRGCELNYDRALLVENALRALKSTPNSAMVPTGDIGESVVIHPARKKEVGDRLAMLALKNQYFYSALDCDPPTVKNIEYKDGAAYVYTVGSDIASTGLLSGFEIAGKDQCYYPAKALVDRRAGYIKVSSPDVLEPVAVRYGFHNYINQNWKSWMGIPAFPFRTDNWDYIRQ